MIFLLSEPKKVFREHFCRAVLKMNCLNLFHMFSETGTKFETAAGLLVLIIFPKTYSFVFWGDGTCISLISSFIVVDSDLFL